MFDNDCPRLIIIHIMAQTTVTTSPLVLSVLSLSQILTLLYAAVFSVRLSFPLICSRPSACSSDVSHPLQQSINPLKWECKSVISEFTLTTHETVDIAQIGFSKKKPSHSRAVRPTACTYPVCFLAHQIWIVPPEDDSSNGSPICNPLCTTVCVFTWAAVLETVRENKGRSKHAVHPWVARAPPGLTNSKHTGWTQHNTTPDMKVIHTSPAIKSYHCYSSRFLENE